MEDNYGHKLLLERLKSLDKSDNRIVIKKHAEIDFSNKLIVTGIGSSKSHAFYLIHLLKKYNVNVEFVELSAFPKLTNTENSTLVLFSQGLSPNSNIALSKKYNNIIIFTAVTEINKNEQKKSLLTKADVIVNFPLEDEYTLLIRVVGPYRGFQAVNVFMNSYFNYQYHTINIAEPINKDLLNILVTQKPQIKFVTTDTVKTFSQNLQYKFLEGCFYPHMPDVCDYLEFSHGHYQNLLVNGGVVIILGCLEDINLSDGVELMCKKHKIPVFKIISNSQDQNIMYYELYLNRLVYQIIKAWNIDQKNWKGKNDNTTLYELAS